MSYENVVGLALSADFTYRQPGSGVPWSRFGLYGAVGMFHSVWISSCT